jgi:HSP20 family molecular chaperone IbpA
MWAEACAMIERVERLHRQFFQPAFSVAPEVTWEPPVDIVESDREVRIVAALPGVEPADVDVHLDANDLVIAGVRKPPSVARGAMIHRLEIPYGHFERRIPLSAARLEVEGSELARGCLSLRLSKKQ